MNVSALPLAYCRCQRASNGLPQLEYHYMATPQGHFTLAPVTQRHLCGLLLPYNADCYG